MNKKRIILQVVIVSLCLAMVFKAYRLMMTEDIHVIEKIPVTYDVPQEEILTSGQETIIKSFDHVSDISWISDTAILINGVIDGQTGNFVFDSKDQVLKRYEDQVNRDEPVDEHLISMLDEETSLLVEGQALIMKRGTDSQVIIENMTYGDQGLYQLSEDKSRLLFYYTKKNNLVTYYFENDFYRTVYTDVPSSILDDFYSLVKLSPLGGYVAIEHPSEDLAGATFSLHGANSGRVYARDVHGIDVSWSKDDKYLTYFYTMESQEIDGESAYINSRRMAYYDITRKAIKFIDSTPADFSMISNTYWDGSRVSVLMGDSDDRLHVNGLWQYDFASGSYIEIPLDLKDLSKSTRFEFISADDMLYLLVVSEEDSRIIRLNMVSHEYDVFENLSLFSVEGQEGYFYHNNARLLTFNASQLTLSHGKEEGYVYIEQDVFEVFPNPDLNGIVVYLPHNNIIKLLKID